MSTSVLWFLLSFLAIAAEDFISTGNGKQLLNGPFSNTILYTFFTLFGTIIIAAIFGTSVLRDFQRDTFQLIFTKPITKFAYLGGRWAGSFVTCVFAFSGMVFGELAGTLAPWADHTRIASGHAWWYWQPFLFIVVIQIFFLGSLFFMVAALSRKIFIVYLQGVAVFMLYLIANAIFAATRSLEHFWSGILDPIGLQLIDVLARYWTVAEKNTLLFSWSPHVSQGVFLYNRLLWLAVGFISLAVCYRFFPMSVEALTASAQGRRAAKAKRQEAAEAQPRRSLVAAPLPRVHQYFGGRAGFAQFVSLTRVRITNTMRELPFWAITVLLTVFALINGHFAGKINDQNVYPVTFLMVQAVEGNATLFLFIIATLYAGELVWRERDTSFSGIHDALPMGETTDWLSKFVALVRGRRRPARCHSLMRRHHADRSGLLPLRSAAVLQGAICHHFPAGDRLHPVGLLCADRRLQQVHGPCDRDRHFCVGSDHVPLRYREHAASARPEHPLHLFRHERLRPLCARRFCGPSCIGRRSSPCSPASPSRWPGGAPRMAGIRA